MAFWTVSKAKSLLKLLIGAVVVYILFRWFEHHQVYVPSRRLDASGRELGRPIEEVDFTASDGVRLNAWFFPADTNSPRKHLVMLHCHGNGGNISHRLGMYEALLATGVNVFAFDYRGYGRSQGRPGEAGTYLDVQAAYRWLREKGFAAPNIIVHGESLGGGIASDLAVREPVGGLVVQNCFTSVPDIGAEFFPWLPARSLGTIRYDVRGKLPRVKVPVLVMHSRGDTTIRFHHGEKNFAAANEPKMFWEVLGDHNDTIESGRERYIEGLNKFLARFGQGQGSAGEPPAKDSK